jgi:hypothetical protein
MKNSNDTIRDRTRDLPACSMVSQPTALPRAPRTLGVLIKTCGKNAPFSVDSQCAVIFMKVTPVSNETLLHYFSVSTPLKDKSNKALHSYSTMTATDTSNRTMFKTFPL